MRSAGASAAASVAVPGDSSEGVGFVSSTVRLALQIGHNRLDLRSQSMISFSWNKCPHGNSITRSPFSKSDRQMLHSTLGLN